MGESWTDLMRLPFASFSYGLGFLADLAEGALKLVVHGLGGLLGGGPSGGAGAAAPASPPCQPIEEVTKMSDQDLSGKDSKLVHYSAVFVKPEFELLLREREELVAYSTDGANFGTQKVGEVMASLGEIRRPQSWKDAHYPPAAGDGDFIVAIPSDDQKYIRFGYHVLRRYTKEDPDWSKQQVEVLREISAKLG